MDYVKRYLNIEGVIGQGAFGKVLCTSPLPNSLSSYPGPLRIWPTPQPRSSTRFALKCIHPLLRPLRLANELRHLRDLGGVCNVVQMHTAHFFKGSLFIVMELIEHDRFVDIVADLTHEEIVIYIKNLLIALKHVHDKGIMHRDIKPGNFLYNRKERKFLLVDFGLAQSVKLRTPSMSIRKDEASTPPTAKRLRVSKNYKDGCKLTLGVYESPVTCSDTNYARRSLYTVAPPKRPIKAKCDCKCKPRICNNCLSRPEPLASKSGTPGFKAPEILLRYQYQSTPIDIWSSGVILACLLAGHYPLFRDVDDTLSLAEIITLLGSQRVIEAAENLGIRLNIEPKRGPVDFANLCWKIRQSEQKRSINIPDAAFDLLYRMLDPNPKTRITADEALQHPWLKQTAYD